MNIMTPLTFHKFLTFFPKLQGLLSDFRLQNMQPVQVKVKAGFSQPVPCHGHWAASWISAETFIHVTVAVDSRVQMVRAHAW